MKICCLIFLTCLYLQAGGPSDWYRQANSNYQTSWTNEADERLFATLTSSPQAAEVTDLPDTMTLIAETPATLWQYNEGELRFHFTSDGNSIHITTNEQPIIHENALHSMPYALGVLGGTQYPGVRLRHMGLRVQEWPTARPLPSAVQALNNDPNLTRYIKVHPFTAELLAFDYSMDGVTSRLPDDNGPGPSGLYTTYTTIEYESVNDIGLRVVRGKNQINGERFHHYFYGGDSIVDVTDISTHKSFSQRQAMSSVTQVYHLDYSKCMMIEENCVVIASTCRVLARDAKNAKWALRICLLLNTELYGCRNERKIVNALWDQWHRCRHDEVDCNAKVEACIADVHTYPY